MSLVLDFSENGKVEGRREVWDNVMKLRTHKTPGVDDHTKDFDVGVKYKNGSSVVYKLHPNALYVVGLNGKYFGHIPHAKGEFKVEFKCDPGKVNSNKKIVSQDEHNSILTAAFLVSEAARFEIIRDIIDRSILDGYSFFYAAKLKPLIENCDKIMRWKESDDYPKPYCSVIENDDLRKYLEAGGPDLKVEERSMVYSYLNDVGTFRDFL